MPLVPIRAAVRDPPVLSSVRGVIRHLARRIHRLVVVLPHRRCLGRHHLDVDETLCRLLCRRALDLRVPDDRQDVRWVRPLALRHLDRTFGRLRDRRLFVTDGMTRMMSQSVGEGR